MATIPIIPVPRGKALSLTDEQLEELALPSETDILDASAMWKSIAPPQYRNLLEAKEKVEE